MVHDIPVETIPVGRWLHRPLCQLLNWRPPQDRILTIGILKGEGVGPAVVDAALVVLRALESVRPLRCEVRTGGPIGLAAERAGGRALSAAVVEFCRDIFACGGAVLAGAGGGRFVYDMRRQFDLYCKISPLVPHHALRGAGSLRPRHVENVDILVVRDNAAGVYQGRWSMRRDAAGGRTAHHAFSYSEIQVRRILQVAAALARERRGELAVVVKPAGVPAVSRLWHECACEVARDSALRLQELEIDCAAYLLIQDPRRFDVVVTSNLFGDILSDVGGVLLGSRGLSYGASFAGTGESVFQTNHGAAHDLAGTDRANPVGQILALAMMLRERFALQQEADLITAAVAQVWQQGLRTADVAEDGCRSVGTRAMADGIAAAVQRLAGKQ